MKDLRIYFNLSLGFVCLFVNHYSCVVLCMLHVPIDCFLRLDFIVQECGDDINNEWFCFVLKLLCC